MKEVEASTIFETSSLFEKSLTILEAFPSYFVSIVATASKKFMAHLAANSIFAPVLLKVFAICKPIPKEHPITRTALSSKEINFPVDVGIRFTDLE